MKYSTLIIATTIAFIGLTQACSPSSQVQPTAQDDTIAAYVDDIFYNYDTNGSTFLERVEAKEFLEDVSDPKPTGREFIKWFETIDTNGDDKLSWNEIYTLAEQSMKQ